MTLIEKLRLGAFVEVVWGERRGSNPRQPESQSGTLPTELRPPLKKNHYSFLIKNLSKTVVLST